MKLWRGMKITKFPAKVTAATFSISESEDYGHESLRTSILGRTYHPYFLHMVLFLLCGGQEMYINDFTI
jgi:hypothetical protein